MAIELIMKMRQYSRADLLKLDFVVFFQILDECHQEIEAIEVEKLMQT